MAIDKDRKTTDPTTSLPNPLDVAPGRDIGAIPGAIPGGMPSSDAILTAPIVMTLERRSKGGGKRGRKKRYSRGTKGVQRLLFGVAKASYRATDSLSSGLNTFVKRSNRSARRRKDGYIRDALRNASRGVGRGLSTLGRAPYEIGRRVPTRAVWRTFRILTPFGN